MYPMHTHKEHPVYSSLNNSSVNDREGKMIYYINVNSLFHLQKSALDHPTL